MYADLAEPAAPRSDAEEPGPEDALDCAESVRVYSERCKAALTRLKNRIEVTPKWDFYKSFSNRYEKIYMLGNCVFVNERENKAPTSRAFFKLWELVCEHWDVFEAIIASPDARRFAYVAEGPGSFVEAVVSMRSRVQREPRASGQLRDAHAGISLRSSGYSVPVWRLNRRWCERNDVRISYGSDGTGNIYALDNVDAFVTDAGGRASCDMVTGDGGFDFSSDFNEQEANMLPMLVSEVLCCMMLLRPGGAAVVKLFDTFNENTIELLHVLRRSFATVRICKPSASRPANAERYLVCAGFAAGERHAAAAAAVRVMREWLAPSPRQKGPVKPQTSELAAAFAALRRAGGHEDRGFAELVYRINVSFALKQIRYIEDTLEHARLKTDAGADGARLRREQIRCADEWRDAYMRTFPPPRAGAPPARLPDRIAHSPVSCAHTSLISPSVDTL